MTRINLVPPSELADQHLFAEFREIKMIPKSLARSVVARGVEGALKMIPAEFTLGTGHVSFFYDKGWYLASRYHSLRHELTRRRIALQAAEVQFRDLYGPLQAEIRFHQDYTPTAEALALVRARIAERLAQRPGWYRYTAPVV
jgi:deoxyribonuclease (pyrimidine dimer)